MDKYKTTLVEQYGIVQKEYVMVPDSLLKKTNELKQYFDISYKYVSGLKPKATAKSKKITHIISWKKYFRKNVHFVALFSSFWYLFILKSINHERVFIIIESRKADGN